MITIAVRRYLRYDLSYRDAEELLAERGINVDQNPPQPVDSPGMLTGSLQLGELAPYRADDLASVGGGQSTSPGAQLQ